MLLPILLTACNSYDEPDGGTREKRVIEFAKPFVNRASRAEAAKDSIPFSEFTVYGFVYRPHSYIFEGELVRRQDNGRWVCDRAEYWYPNQTYYFTGIAPADSPGLKFSPAKKGTGTMAGEAPSLTTSNRQREKRIFSMLSRCSGLRSRSPNT